MGIGQLRLITARDFGYQPLTIELSILCIIYNTCNDFSLVKNMNVENNTNLYIALFMQLTDAFSYFFDVFFQIVSFNGKQL